MTKLGMTRSLPHTLGDEPVIRRGEPKHHLSLSLVCLCGFQKEKGSEKKKFHKKKVPKKKGAAQPGPTQPGPA